VEDSQRIKERQRNESKMGNNKMKRGKEINK